MVINPREPYDDEGVRDNGDGTYSVDLEYPIPHGEKGELRSLTVRRLKAADMEAVAKADDAMKTIVLLASVSGQPTGVIRKLDMADVDRLDALIQTLLERTRGKSTGE